MATSPSLPLQSPTTSTASYDFLSSLSASSDDEVVYAPGSVSSDSSSSTEDGISDDDDDFVVLSRARSPCHPAILSPSGESSFSTDDVLSSAISTLSMSQSSAAAFFRDAVAHRFGAERPSLIATVSATSAPQAPVAPKFKPVLTKEQKKKAVEKRKAKKARRKAREAASSTGKFPVVDDASSVASQLTKAQRKKARKAMQGAVTPTPHFPVIDDASSVASEDSTTSTITGYEDASDFITGFLANPDDKDTVCKLTLLHSLIIELGVVADPSTLPGTITSAKKLLKAEAHINIREYMEVRQQGQNALKGIMHASRGSLVKSIRKKRNPASLVWVKKQGLAVLLVQCFC